VLDDIAARDAASKMLLAAAPTDDDLLHALLSFAVMSVRAPIVEFLTEATSRLTESDRDTWKSLLKRLFRVAHEPRPTRHFDRYQPQHLSVTARHATYSANLVLLAVCAAGSISTSELFGSQTDAVRRWHSQTLLWRSQLVPEEWTSLVETFTLHRLWDNDLPDVQLRLEEFTFQVPAIDPCWTFGSQLRRNQESFYAFGYNAYEAQALRRKAYFQCGIDDDVVHHVVEPLTAVLGETVNLFTIGLAGNACLSTAHALVEVWLLPLRCPEPEERRIVYERCAKVATNLELPSDQETRYGYCSLLLDRLTTDYATPSSAAADVLEMFTYPMATEILDKLAPHIVRCSLAFLGQDHDSDRRLAKTISPFLPDLHLVGRVLGLEAWVRLAEFGLPLPPAVLAQQEQSVEFDELVRSVAERRPDLIQRIRRIEAEVRAARLAGE
jgi:hypothetical protein